MQGPSGMNQAIAYMYISTVINGKVISCRKDACYKDILTAVVPLSKDNPTQGQFKLLVVKAVITKGSYCMQALDTETVKDYLAERAQLAKRLGPKDTKASWQVSCLCCLR